MAPNLPCFWRAAPGTTVQVCNGTIAASAISTGSSKRLVKHEPYRRRDTGYPDRDNTSQLLGDGYGLPVKEARGLLSGSIPVEINEAAGTITYEVSEVAPALLLSVRSKQMTLF